jgi:PadR family transcriptional regulator PadR
MAAMEFERNSNFMTGVPELVIMRLLQHQEMYGYEIVAAIRAKSGNVVNLAEGVVYPVLHRLERERALKSRSKTVNGRSRIYYTLTAKGARRLNDLAMSWNSLNAALQNILVGGIHAV